MENETFYNKLHKSYIKVLEPFSLFIITGLIIQ